MTVEFNLIQKAIRFRDIQESDSHFLLELYASSRKREMDLIPHWSQSEKNQFLKQQFDAQHKYYQQTFFEASFELVLWEERPIGRLYLDRREDELRIIDIALVANYRRKGIGHFLMKNVIKEASQFEVPVRIHVAKNNPARNFYFGLGFVDLEDQDVYYLMELPYTT